MAQAVSRGASVGLVAGRGLLVLVAFRARWFRVVVLLAEGRPARPPLACRHANRSARHLPRPPGRRGRRPLPRDPGRTCGGLASGWYPPRPVSQCRSWIVVGIPLGTWLSARAHGPVTWWAPRWPELGRRFAGSGLMGVGGTLAAGCNVGNALTGFSVLAVNSVIATAAIVGGATVAIAWPGIRRRIPGLHMTRDQS